MRLVHSAVGWLVVLAAAMAGVRAAMENMDEETVSYVTEMYNETESATVSLSAGLDLVNLLHDDSRFADSMRFMQAVVDTSTGTGSGVVSFTSVQLKKYESLVSVYARIKLNDTSPHCNLTLWTTVGSGNELQLKQVAREGNGWFTFDLQQAMVCSGGQEPLVSVGDVRAEATWIDQERRSASGQSGSNPQVVKSIVLVYMQTNQSMDSGYPIPKMKDSTTSIAAAKQAAALTAVKRSPANSISPCRVVKYFVTYEEVDLGLGDIIFPPNGFDLNFCAGDCNSHEITPTSKLLYNHSIYQREAHTLHKDVPGITCVPHTLNPRTFVYHDPQDSEMVAMTQMLYVKIPKDGCTCL